MYENCVSATHPGTEMKVTPDKEAPIIPKATKYQGDCRLAVKKVLESLLLVVVKEIVINRAK
ncbi:hypothetical protein GCM10009122_47480 [Fulvivirga kasyanovii]